MEPVSYTLNFVEKTITVTFSDDTEKLYTDAGSYLADYPERKGDAYAVWEIES